MKNDYFYNKRFELFKISFVSSFSSSNFLRKTLACFDIKKNYWHEYSLHFSIVAKLCGKLCVKKISHKKMQRYFREKHIEFFSLYSFHTKTLSRNIKVKGLVASCHSFFIYFTLSEHTYNIYICNSMRTASSFLHRFRSVEGLLWGAEPRFELGPALQQADALQFAPRRTLLRHAAP